MYLHATVSDRDSSSIFEEPFDGRSLSKLNLCEDGECRGLGLGCEVSPARPHPPTPPLLQHTSEDPQRASLQPQPPTLEVPDEGGEAAQTTTQGEK